MNSPVNRRVVLTRLPVGLPQDTDFAVQEVPAAKPGAGELLLEVVYLSMDPYQRNWMGGAANYGVPAAPGATVIGRAVSRVLESNDARFAAGDWVMGETGWQTHPVAKADVLQKIDATLGPVSTSVGVLGSPGLTGWVGINDIGDPKPGETVVVSAAAGAVGSVAGQVAKMRGARVVGVAGDPEKCRFVTEELGFDACLSHRASDFAAQLAAVCPKGVDVYFDNTGGAVTDAVWARLAVGARIALCGLVAEYGDAKARGPNLLHLLGQQARVQGFSVRSNLHRMPEYRRQASQWIREGKLKYREDITVGIENAPAAFRGQLQGKNLGKPLVQVAADPTR